MVDNNEELSYKIEYYSNEGEIIDLSIIDSNNLPWLTWNENTSILKFSPTINEMGEHYIRVSCQDKAGLLTSQVIGILVRHRNKCGVAMLMLVGHHS